MYVANNAGAGFSIYISCPPGQGAVFTYLVKYDRGAGSKRARGSYVASPNFADM